GIDHRADIVRVGDQLRIQARLSSHPQTIGDRIGGEGQEDRRIRHEKGNCPGELRAVWTASPNGPPSPRSWSGLCGCENLLGAAHLAFHSARPRPASEGPWERAPELPPKLPTRSRRVEGASRLRWLWKYRVGRMCLTSRQWSSRVTG